MTHKDRIKALRKRERTHLQALRYCMRHGLYTEALKHLGWAIQAQATRETLETMSQRESEPVSRTRARTGR